MNTTAGSLMRWAVAMTGMVGACAVARDARADVHPRLVLNFAGTQFTGISTAVEERTTSVNGAVQYRVNMLAMTSDGKKLLCTIAVASVGDAESYRKALLDERAAQVTCTVTHPVTTDPSAGTFVFLNMMSSANGDSLVIESH